MAMKHLKSFLVKKLRVKGMILKFIIFSVIFYFIALVVDLKVDFSDLQELRGFELFCTILRDFGNISILLLITGLLFDIVVTRFNIK